MDETRPLTEEEDEQGFADALELRQAMLQAAVGNLVLDNVPTPRVRILMRWTTDPTMRFACQIVLHQRGEDWQV